MLAYFDDKNPAKYAKLDYLISKEKFVNDNSINSPHDPSSTVAPLISL